MKRIITLIAVAMLASAVSVSAADMTESISLIDKKPSKKKAAMKEVTFYVHLHCENCKNKVQENIAFEKGVKDLKVSLDDQTVYIKYDSVKTSEDVLKAAIETLGYPVSGTVKPGHQHSHEHHAH